MSVHPSLKDNSDSSKNKSVLKRLERLLHLLKKDEWKEGDTVFGLPKIKIMKFKVKKEKAEKTEEEIAAAGAEGTVEGAAGTTEEGKGAAPEKEAGQPTGKAGKKPAGKEKK